jgi:hypothetical protein
MIVRTALMFQRRESSGTPREDRMLGKLQCLLLLIIQASSFDLRNTMIFACINQTTAIDGVLCLFTKN